MEKVLLNLPLSAKLSNSALQSISAIDHLELKENEKMTFNLSTFVYTVASYILVYF